MKPEKRNYSAAEKARFTEDQLRRFEQLWAETGLPVARLMDLDRRGFMVVRVKPWPVPRGKGSWELDHALGVCHAEELVDALSNLVYAVETGKYVDQWQRHAKQVLIETGRPGKSS